MKSNGSKIEPWELAEEVMIGFGTGVGKGQFAQDHVCLCPAAGQSLHRKGCLEMHFLMALEMSDNAFKSFLFDGIIGLGLPMLAISYDFSFFQLMSHSGQVAASQFVFFVRR